MPYKHVCGLSWASQSWSLDMLRCFLWCDQSVCLETSPVSVIMIGYYITFRMPVKAWGMLKPWHKWVETANWVQTLTASLRLFKSDGQGWDPAHHAECLPGVHEAWLWSLEAPGIGSVDWSVNRGGVEGGEAVGGVYCSRKEYILKKKKKVLTIRIHSTVALTTDL